MAARFEVFKGADSQFYFRLKTKIGETICTSEGYKSKQDCLKGIKSLKSKSFFASTFVLVKDDTKEKKK